MNFFKHKNNQNGLPTTETVDEKSKSQIKGKVTAAIATAALAGSIVSGEIKDNSEKIPAPAPIEQTYPERLGPPAPENVVNAWLPGDPRIPANQDKGTPDEASPVPLIAGDTPAESLLANSESVGPKPAEAGDSPLLSDEVRRDQNGINTGVEFGAQQASNMGINGDGGIPVEGIPPVGIDSIAPVQVPGTDNETPKGGSVDPNTIPAEAGINANVQEIYQGFNERNSGQ